MRQFLMDLKSADKNKLFVYINIKHMSFPFIIMQKQDYIIDSILQIIDYVI